MLLSLSLFLLVISPLGSKGVVGGSSHSPLRNDGLPAATQADQAATNGVRDEASSWTGRSASETSQVGSVVQQESSVVTGCGNFTAAAPGFTRDYVKDKVSSII